MRRPGCAVTKRTILTEIRMPPNRCRDARQHAVPDRTAVTLSDLLRPPPSGSPCRPKKVQKKANEADTNNSAIEQQSKVPKAKATRLSELRNIAQGDEQGPSKQYDDYKAGDSSGHWVPRDLQRHDPKLQSPMLASHRQAPPSVAPPLGDRPAALRWRQPQESLTGKWQ